MPNEKIDSLTVKNQQGTDITYDIDLPADATPSIASLTVSGNITEGNKTLGQKYAPISHASTNNTYGLGTTTEYGHVKVQSGSMDGTSSTNGVAAGLGHTHPGYANQNAFSNIAVGSTNIGANSATDTFTINGSNLIINGDATNNIVNISLTSDGVVNALGYTPVNPTGISDATITIKQTGISDQTFTLNGSAKTITLVDNNTTYTFAEGSTNKAFTVTPSGGTAQTVSIHGLGDASLKGVATSVTSGSSDLVTGGAVYNALPTVNNASHIIQLNGTTIGTNFTANASSNITTNIQALPNYSLSISTSGGNPREVKFVRVNYTNFTSNYAAYFKIGAMCSHGNGSSYTFLEDIIIGVNMNGAVTCTIYKQVQNTTTYTVDNHIVHFGDVYWVVDTTNKYVDFYIICGQYATMNFTPFTAIGSTSKSTSEIVQQTGSATLYSSGTRIWDTLGNGSLYAKTSDIPTKTSDLTNDSGFITSADLPQVIDLRGVQ